MKSGQKEIKGLQDEIKKSFNGFVQVVTDYKKNDAKGYDDRLWAPRMQQANIDYLTEIEGSLAFLQVSVDALLDSKTAAYRKQGYAEMLNTAITKLQCDVDLYVNAPGIRDGEKTLCAEITKQLSDLGVKMKPFQAEQNNKPKV